MVVVTYQMLENANIESVVIKHLQVSRVKWRVQYTDSRASTVQYVKKTSFFITDDILEKTTYDLYFTDAWTRYGGMEHGDTEVPIYGWSDSVAKRVMSSETDVETLIKTVIPSVSDRISQAGRKANEEIQKLKAISTRAQMKKSIQDFLATTDILQWTNALMEKFYRADIPRVGLSNEETLSELKTQVTRMICNQMG